MPHFSSSQSKFLIRVSLKNTLSLICERPRTTLKINSLNRALAQSCCDHTHTFIQPVSESIEDDSLHPRGGDPQRVTPHIRLVVDVILKYVDLKKERRWWGDWFYYSCSSRLFFCSFFLLLLSNSIWSVFPFDFLSDEILLFHIKASGLSPQRRSVFTLLLPSVF